MGTPDVSAVFDWLVDGAPGARGPEDVVARLGPWLRECGVPIARVAAFVRTLHPHIMGRSFEWIAGHDGVKVLEASYAVLRSEMYAKSPVGAVFASGRELRRRLDGSEPLDMAELVAFAADGYTDYVVLPLRFLDGQTHAIVLSTKEPGGFTEAQVDAVRKIVRPLSRIAEILALRRTATNLLSAYVGRDAGERILRGQVQRGDTESIRCVVWFSDLRGFTDLSAGLDPRDVIRLLNRVFDCQVPSVEKAGGEVLKFMGDGMLAIFPITEEQPAQEVARRALDAARDAFAALDAMNASGEDAPRTFGVALHVGDVAYGNVGGVARLDFTCIGTAVNFASRLQGLASKLGKRLLLSEEVAALVPDAARLVGAFELKGIESPQRVFEAADHSQA
jgi:adenylate cyclase